MDIINLVNRNTGEITRVWDGRKTMRTLADALAKLDELRALVADGEAEIGLALLGLPDGRVVGSLGIAASHGEARWRVMMPAAAEATAKDTLGTPVRLEIERLHGAVADPDGTVQLRDGTYVHALELVPVHLTERLTVEQEEILGHVIRFLEAERECFRSVHEILPRLVTLDYAVIAQLWERRLQEGRPPPTLKVIERYVTDRMPNVSRQTITNVLALAGLRRPRSGPRARQRRRNGQAATI